jgi:4'-phosphopantetheinyl transferase
MYVTDISQSEEFYDMWYNRMPKERRVKADRYRVDVVRKRCITAYALLVYALCDGQKDGLIPQGIDSGSAELAISEDDDGKPHLEGIPICFNISHSGDMVAVAISPGEVGCDVECKSKNAMSIAEHFFAKDEVEFLSNIEDDALQSLEFTKLWTMKESVVKCSGEGIRRAFSDFSLIDCVGERVGHLTLPGRNDTFRVREFESKNGYCFSVCSVYEDIEDKIRYVRLEDE